MEQNEATILKKGYSKEEKQELIASWQRSGKSRAAFSKDGGINYHTLISWTTSKKKKQRSVKPEPASAGFSEVKLAPSTDGKLFARIGFGKTSIDIFQPVSSQYLKELADA